MTLLHSSLAGWPRFATPAAGGPWLAALAIPDKSTIFAVIAGYLLMLMVLGVVFRRFSRDTSDYFRAGGMATWWLMGGSVFMQAFSAWTFTGAAGAAFQAGWSLPTMFVSNALGFLTVALISAAWFRQLRCVTTADLVRLRFGAGMEQFIAGVGLVTGPIFGGVQLYGLAIFVSLLLGVNLYGTIAILGFVVLFYAGISGAWAVMAADFIKALVLMPITVLVAVLSLREIGGVGGLLGAIGHAGLSASFAPVKSPEVLAGLPGINPGWFTWSFFLAWYANNILNANALTSAGRYLSAKDGREARRAALLACGLFFLGLVIWFVPPMAARLLLAPDVMAMPLPKPAEGAYAAIAIHLLPAGLVGVVLVGMCASTMSALDVGLNSLAGNITQNIYPAVCRVAGLTPWEGWNRLVFAKAVSFLCAVAVIGCALAMARYSQGGIFKLLVDAVGTILPPMYVPMVLGLFLRRVPTAAPVIGTGAGLAVSLAIFLGPRLGGTEPWTFQAQVGTVIAVTAAAFLLARALRPADGPELEREQEFFARRDRPVDFAREIGEGNDGRQLRVVGAFGTVLGLALLLLLLPPSSAGHEWKIAVVAATTVAVGTLMLWRGFRPGAAKSR